MFRRALIVTAAAATVLAPSPAGAKELVALEICGPDECTTVNDRASLAMVPTGGENTLGPPPVAPFVRLRFTIDHEGTSDSWQVYYVPASNVLAGRDGDDGLLSWFPTYGREAEVLRRLAARVKPFPAPTLNQVTIGGRTTTGDPSSYLGLFVEKVAPPAVDSPLVEDWQAVDLHSTVPSPWTDAARDLMYSPSHGLLERGAVRLQLPAAVDDDLRAARTIDGATAPDGDVSARTVTLGAIGAVAALASLALLALRLGRRRRGTGPAAAQNPL
jgi:hypothetical protein